MKYCCDNLRKAVDSETVLFLNGGSFHIHGRPSFAYDGNGRYDDMTEEFEIHFCPFCGYDLAFIGSTDEAS